MSSNTNKTVDQNYKHFYKQLYKEFDVNKLSVSQGIMLTANLT